MIQPLAAAMLSGPSLTAAAAAALAIPPVVGLDITSWAQKGRCSSSSPGKLCVAPEPPANSQPLVVVAEVVPMVDALGLLLGRPTSHFQCCPSTSSMELQGWLSSLARAAGQPASCCDGCSGAAADSLLASATGLQHLQPSVLAAFSRALGSIQQLLQQQGVGRPNSPASTLQKLQLPDGSWIQCSIDNSAVSNSAGGLAVFCQLPETGTSSDGKVTSWKEGSSSSRLDVVGAVQRWGRCMAVQPPSLLVVLECGLRQLGLLDCSGAAAMLAVLLQQASELQCSSWEQHGQDLVAWAAVQQLLQHLVGLQQQGRPAFQQSSSAWGVLQEALQACVLPQLDCVQHQAALLNTLESGVKAAQRAGRVTGTLPKQSQVAVQQQCSRVPGTVEAGCTAPAAANGRVGSNNTPGWPYQWTAEQVAGAVNTMSACTRSASRQAIQRGMHGSMVSTDGSAVSVGKTAEAAAGDAAALLPALVASAAAESAAALHVALQVHGVCLLTGPAGVGKTLSWRALAAAYQSLGAGTAPVGVHCCADVLVEQAEAASGGKQGGSPSDRFIKLLESFHTSALQQSSYKGCSAGTAASQAGTTAVSAAAPAERTAASSATTPTPQQNILVLDVDVLEGLLLDVLQQQLQQHNRRSSSCHPTPWQPLWWQLPGCTGCIVECSKVADSAAIRLGPVRLLPMVAVRPPGVLDAEEQLLQLLRAGFIPMAVLPQSQHAACSTRHAGDQASSECSCCAAPEAASKHHNQHAAQAQQPGLGGNTLFAYVSDSMISRLAAALQDMVGAGLSARRSAKLPAHDEHSGHSSSGVAAHPSSWEASRLVLACCTNAVRMTAAMWRQASPCPAARCCCTGSRTAEDMHQNGSNSSGELLAANAAEATSPAEVLAAQLLVFCASWVVAGSCGHQDMQLLRQSIHSVLVGAGFSWAVPPAAVGGLFGARLDLTTGQWVSWQQDVDAMSTERRSSAEDDEPHPPPYYVCKAATPGVFSKAISSASESSRCCSGCGTWREGCLFLPSTRTCAVQYLVNWSAAAGISLLLVAAPACGIRAAVGQLLAHSRPGAAQVGLPPSSLPASHPSAAYELQSVRTSSQRLVSEPQGGSVLLPVSSGMTAGHLGVQAFGIYKQCAKQQRQTGAAATAAALCAADAAVPAGAGCCTRRCTRLSSSSTFTGGSTWRSSRSSMAQDHAKVAAVPAGDGSRYSVASASVGTAMAVKQLLLCTEDWSCSTSAMEWHRQLLEAQVGLAFGCSVSAGDTAATAAGAAAGCVASTACTVVPMEQPQLLSILLDSRAVAAGTAGSSCASFQGTKLSRHMLMFQVDCLSILPDCSAAHEAHAAKSSNSGNCGYNISCGHSLAPQPNAPHRFTLVNSEQVLAALFHRYSCSLPGVHDVPKAKILQGLQCIWQGLTIAVQHLQQHKSVSAFCCFDMRHFRNNIERLINILGQHIAQLDSNKCIEKQLGTAQRLPSDGAARPVTTPNIFTAVLAAPATSASTPTAAAAAYGSSPATPASPFNANSPCGPGIVAQKSVASMWSLPAGTPTPPYTPCGPQPSPSVAAATMSRPWGHQSSSHGGAGLGSRKLPLRAVCCAVLEVLCR